MSKLAVMEPPCSLNIWAVHVRKYGATKDPLISQHALSVSHTCRCTSTARVEKLPGTRSYTRRGTTVSFTIHCESMAPVTAASTAPGHRFAPPTADNHSAPIWIASILSLIFAFCILAVRLGFVKWNAHGLDDFVLILAHVSARKHPTAYCITA
jgi:hypothetical protein